MDNINFTPRSKKIGLIVPASNTNAEPDCVSLCQPEVTIHSARSGGYDVEKIPDSTEMRNFARRSLDQNCKDLIDARVDIIAYGCTSATLSEGPIFDTEFCQMLEEKTGLPSVTTAGALVRAIQQINVSKVAFTSPYVKLLSREAVDFLEASAISVVNEYALKSELNSLEQNTLTPQDAYDMALKADHDDAEAIVVSCTDFRALEAIPALERILKKPVITSNQALMFACLTQLGLSTSNLTAGGSLFTGLNPAG
ncbi:MAG: aspartate/glutamate racemase family protein [Pseudomonadota bacterium]